MRRHHRTSARIHVPAWQSLHNVQHMVGRHLQVRGQRPARIRQIINTRRFYADIASIFDLIIDFVIDPFVPIRRPAMFTTSRHTARLNPRGPAIRQAVSSWDMHDALRGEGLLSPAWLIALVAAALLAVCDLTAAQVTPSVDTLEAELLSQPPAVGQPGFILPYS